MIYKLEMAWKEQKQNVRAEYFSKLEEEGTKYGQLVQRLKAILENNLLDMCKYTQQFLSQYEEKTRARKREHYKLKKQDDSVQELLLIQLEKLRRMSEHLRRLKSKYEDSRKLLGRKLKDIKYEHDYFTFAFNCLKTKLEVDRATDFDQLRTLTVSYNSAVKYLEKLKEKGEHILQAAAVCRKLETQEEKIMPYPIPENSIKVFIDDQPEYLECMDLFWQRFAQVEASRYSISEEREFLKTENEILKMKLHKYCMCVSCPARENKIAAKFDVNKIKKGAYITEGVEELRKYRKQNYRQFSSNDDNFEID